MDNQSTAGVDLDALEAEWSTDGDYDVSSWPIDPATVRALIAMARRAQPRVTEQAGELCIGVSNNDQGVHVNIMQRYADGTTAIIYAAKAPPGDSFGRAALTQAAPEAPALRPLSAGLPSPDDYDRVLVYTEGVDFAGEQYFDIKTDDLWEPEERTEVVEAATHWMPLPRPGTAPAPAAQQAGAAERCACGTHTKAACDFAGSCGRKLPAATTASEWLTVEEAYEQSEHRHHLDLASFKGLCAKNGWRWKRPEATTASASGSIGPALVLETALSDADMRALHSWQEAMRDWYGRAPAPSRDAVLAPGSDLKLEAALDREYPLPNSPHASVNDRAHNNRAAFERGWYAALAQQGASGGGK